MSSSGPPQHGQRPTFVDDSAQQMPAQPAAPPQSPVAVAGLADHDHFEDAAQAEVKARFGKPLLPVTAIAAVFGFLGSLGNGGTIATAAFGAAATAGLVAAAFWLFLRWKAGRLADRRYAEAWCRFNGCRELGAYAPPNGPFADSGFRQHSQDAIQGQRDGLGFIFYNFSYWTRSTDGQGRTTTTEHPYTIVQLWGAELPVQSMSVGERHLFNRWQWMDKLDSSLTSQKVVELESIAFNEQFKLEVHDACDMSWLLRVFDPVTIDAIVARQLELPAFRYYDRSFWLVSSGHYDAEELDHVLARVARATPALRHLARVAA